MSEWPPDIGTERLQGLGEPLHNLTHEPIGNLSPRPCAVDRRPRGLAAADSWWATRHSRLRSCSSH